MLRSHCLGLWESHSGNKLSHLPFTSNTLLLLSLAVWSSLTQLGSMSPPQACAALEGISATSRESAEGTRSLPASCQAGPALGNSQAQVSPSFSRANSSQEQSRQQILRETVAAACRRDGGLSASLEEQWVGGKGFSVPRLPWYSQSQPAGPLLPQEPWSGRTGCFPSPSLLGFFQQPHPRAARITWDREPNRQQGLHSQGCSLSAGPPADMAMLTLTHRFPPSCDMPGSPRILDPQQTGAPPERPCLPPAPPAGLTLQRGEGRRRGQDAQACGAGSRLRGLCCHLQGTAGLVAVLLP